MSSIVAGSEGIETYEGRAVDLPEIEPTATDLLAIDADLDIVDDRLTTLDVQVSEYGHVDDLATRRYRRAVRAALRTAESAEVAA